MSRSEMAPHVSTACTLSSRALSHLMPVEGHSSSCLAGHPASLLGPILDQPLPAVVKAEERRPRQQEDGLGVADPKVSWCLSWGLGLRLCGISGWRVSRMHPWSLNLGRLWRAPAPLPHVVCNTDLSE